jgi:hypothetical protein
MIIHKGLSEKIWKFRTIPRSFIPQFMLPLAVLVLYYQLFSRQDWGWNGANLRGRWGSAERDIFDIWLIKESLCINCFLTIKRFQIYSLRAFGKRIYLLFLIFREFYGAKTEKLIGFH